MRAPLERVTFTGSLSGLSNEHHAAGLPEADGRGAGVHRGDAMAAASYPFLGAGYGGAGSAHARPVLCGTGAAGLVAYSDGDAIGYGYLHALPYCDGYQHANDDAIAHGDEHTDTHGDAAPYLAAVRPGGA